MEATLDSRKAGSWSRPGRTRRNDGGPRDRARDMAGSTLDETTKARIYGQSKCGASVEVLAKQFGLRRSHIERVVSEMRAKCPLRPKLEFMSDPSFDDPSVVAEILGPSPEPAVGRAPRRTRAPEGLPPYLVSLYDVPLLSWEQERHLFRKMNYLNYRAHRLREALDPSHCDVGVGAQ